jgi:hypothetical protein
MPVNYAAYQNANNPLQMAIQGYSDAGAIQQARQQQQIGEQDLLLNQMKIDEYKKAQLKQQRYQKALGDLTAKPNKTAQDFFDMQVQFPEVKEAYDSQIMQMNKEQLGSRVSQAQQIVSAITMGQTDIAKKLMGTYKEAAENSKDKMFADSITALQMLIEADPESAAVGLNGFLAAADPENFPTNYGILETARRANELQPMLKDEATAKAAEAAIKAKFAESLAAAEASSKGFDISSLITDPKIAKQNKRIANLINARDKATSELSLQKLESDLNDAQIARDNATIEKASEVETAQLNVDTMMSTVEDLEALGEQKITTMGIPFQNVREAATGTLEGSDAWYNATWNPPVADYQETIKTLQDQVFLTQIPKMKGMGALSGPEGNRLAGALKSLSLRQSSERLKNNIATIKELTNKAQKFLQNKYGDIGANTAEAKSRISAGGMGVQVPGEQTSSGQFRIINRRPGTE